MDHPIVYRFPLSPEMLMQQPFQKLLPLTIGGGTWLFFLDGVFERSSSQPDTVHLRCLRATLVCPPQLIDTVEATCEWLLSGIGLSAQIRQPYTFRPTVNVLEVEMRNFVQMKVNVAYEMRLSLNFKKYDKRAFLGEFVKKSDDRDFEIDIGNVNSYSMETVFASKQALSSASAYFEALFRGDYSEVNQNKMSVNDDNLIAFVEMIKFCHFSEQFTIYEAIAEPLLVLADKYQVRGLKQRCEDFLVADCVARSFTAAEKISRMKLALTYKLEKLKTVVAVSLKREECDQFAVKVSEMQSASGGNAADVNQLLFYLVHRLAK